MARATTKRAPAKATRKVPADGARTHNIPVLLDSEPEAAKALLAKHVAGWDDLKPNEQDEFLELALAQQAKPQPVAATLAKTENGVNLTMAGKCEALGILKLQQTFAAVSIPPVDARANDLLNYLRSVGADNESRYNAALSFIESMAPQNQAEALLLVQMYCTHDAAMRAITQLGKQEWVPHVQTFGNLAAKLLKTSQGQMEALTKMRRGGVQEVRHTHYYVDNRGGQAVFTDNVTTGGANSNATGQSHEPTIVDQCAALPSPHPFGDSMPLPGAPGPDALSPAWREQSGRADG